MLTDGEFEALLGALQAAGVAVRVDVREATLSGSTAGPPEFHGRFSVVSGLVDSIDAVGDVVEPVDAFRPQTVNIPKEKEVCVVFFKIKVGAPKNVQVKCRGPDLHLSGHSAIPKRVHFLSNAVPFPHQTSNDWVPSMFHHVPGVWPKPVPNILWD